MQIQKTGIVSKAYFSLQKNDNLCYFLLSLIAAGFVMVEWHEVFEKEIIYNGFDNSVKDKILPNCSYDSVPYNRGTLNWYLVCVSYLTFDNPRIIPTLISFGVIPVSFLLVRKMSNNVVSLLVTAGLVYTPAFYFFDTSAAFSQTWALLFLGSLYFARKNAYVCTGLYIASLTAKAIPIIWLPVILYLILKSGRQRNEKIISSCVLVVVVAVLGFSILFTAGNFIYGGNLSKNPITLDSFQKGLWWTWFTFRWNELFLLSMPVIVSVYLVFRKRLTINAEPVILALYSIATVFLISSLTTEGYFPYRILPNTILILYACSSILHDVVHPKLSK